MLRVHGGMGVRDYRYSRADLLDKNNLYSAIKAASTGEMLAHHKDIRDTVQTYKAVYDWNTDLTYHASWRKMGEYFAARFIDCKTIV